MAPSEKRNRSERDSTEAPQKTRRIALEIAGGRLSHTSELQPVVKPEPTEPRHIVKTEPAENTVPLHANTIPTLANPVPYYANTNPYHANTTPYYANSTLHYADSRTYQPHGLPYITDPMYYYGEAPSFYPSHTPWNPAHPQMNLQNTIQPDAASAQPSFAWANNNPQRTFIAYGAGPLLANARATNQGAQIKSEHQAVPAWEQNVSIWQLPQAQSTPSTFTRSGEPVLWRADPNKLGYGKNAKYYGVRIGRKPGIYYHWSEAETQVSGFKNAVYQSSKEQEEIEHYMNHEPADCRYKSCAATCSEALSARQQNIADNSNARSLPAMQIPAAGPSNNAHWPASERRGGSPLLPAHNLEQNGEIGALSIDSSTPYSSTSSDSSTSTKTSASSPTSRICKCETAPPVQDSKQVTCANPDCEVKMYHAVCVGLAKRVPDPTWRCRDCRVPPPPMTSSAASAISQIAPGQTEPPLSGEQAAVVELILRGSNNVCYTGSAGTGKSTVLKAVVRSLREQHKTVSIVAPSGIAALAVGGQTIFTYAGWVPDTFKLPLWKLAKRAFGKRIRRRLCATDVLIIEEISMVDSHMFERLERVCREARDAAIWDKDVEMSGHGIHDSSLPFGGIKVIVTGDFCQLPPVKPFKFCLYCGGDELPGWHGNHGKPLTCPQCKRTYADDDKWAFRSEAWGSCKFKYVELTEIHRQSDPVFTAILQKCRRGLPLSPEDKQLLLHHPSNTVDAVHLRPTIAEVLRINEAAFRLLPGVVHTYDCYDDFDWRKELHPDLESRQYRRIDGKYANRNDGPLKALQDHRFEECLPLKIDTLVILLVNLNLEAGLVNGAQGKVVGFQPYSKDGGAQPQDHPSSYLPEAVGDYSKVRDEQVRKFVQTRKLRAWPIVEFNNGVTQIIYAQCQLSELGSEEPYSIMSRTQIPLIPAWAITVHKSQGMTLSRVEVDLSRAFEREMIYVALSRCKSLDGLKVHNLPRNMDYGPNLVVQEFLEIFKPASTLVSKSRKTPMHGSHVGGASDPIVLD